MVFYACSGDAVGPGKENQANKQTKLPASDPKQCVGGHQQRILYVSLPIRAATNRMKLVYKTFVCVFCALHISRSSAGTMSPMHVLASTNMDSRLNNFISQAPCNIHICLVMSQHPCVSQDPLQDPCLRIHISAAICISGSSTRSTSSDSCRSIFVSHGFSARSMSPDSCLSTFVSQDPLQDPCLRAHVSGSLYPRILCKIHVSGLMSQHLCISGFSTRPMSSDSCLSID